MESAQLIHLALGFLLTVLPRALTCPRVALTFALDVCPKSAQPMPYVRAEFRARLGQKLGQF